MHLLCIFQRIPFLLQATMGELRHAGARLGIDLEDNRTVFGQRDIPTDNDHAAEILMELDDHLHDLVPIRNLITLIDGSGNGMCGLPLPTIEVMSGSEA